MPRRPFNPDNIANPPMDMTTGAVPSPASRVGMGAGAATPAAPVAAGRGAANSVTVTQLAAMVRGALTTGLPAKIRVIGEVSNLSSRAHWFFNLKDQGASIRCVCFASNVRRITFKVGDGMEVIATGRVDFYDAQGNVQLYVDKLEPVGVGELERRYRALCDELRKLGYFEESRKKPLPPMPQRIAIVTSRGGAALHDVINTARKRWRGCKLMLFDVLTAGGESVVDLAYDDRRALLDRLVESGGAVSVPPSVGTSLASAMATSLDLGLEGVVAKRRTSPYRPGRRSPDWVKIRHERAQEVIVGGWRPGEGERRGDLGALLLGMPGPTGLVYVGRVGTGFSAAERRRILTALEPLAADVSPFDEVPAEDAAGARWVLPERVAEVALTGWTGGDRLRHAVWRGWRPDKRPDEVVRE